MIFPQSLIVDIVNHVKYNQVPASSIKLYECIPLRFLPMLDKFIILQLNYYSTLSYEKLFLAFAVLILNIEISLPFLCLPESFEHSNQMHEEKPTNNFIISTLVYTQHNSQSTFIRESK